MNLSLFHKKIIARLSDQYQGYDKKWAMHRDNVRQAITGTRITRKEADTIIRELERTRRIKRINRSRIRLI